MNRGTLNATISLGPGEEAHWRPYFTVASVAETLVRVDELGGSVVMPPIAIPGDGSIALVLDPQGALFGLFEGPTDP
jgi:predicted enzyme related to lactoylglutathione lyase